MKKITLETPFGQEILCQSTLDAVILHLSEALLPITASYAASPAVARLVKQMLPTVREEWRSQTTDGTAYPEVTPDVLMGFGFSLSLYDLPDLPPPPLSPPAGAWLWPWPRVCGRGWRLPTGWPSARCS